MILLPRGTPVKENLNPGRINLPDALGKLQAGSFTGYLRFDAPTGTGVLIFDKGRLISALFSGERESQIAYDAIATIFEQSLEGNATLDIYRLSPELALSIHALLHGDVLYRGQELKLIDIRALLGRMKDEQMTGCLRIYTGDRIALIFYRNGTPLGFFHDGSTELETSADTSMSVARLPGAKVDVLTTRTSEEHVLADLLASADLAALWQKARLHMEKEREAREQETRRSKEILEKERRQKARQLLADIAKGHIGKMGASLVDKEFDRLVGPTATLNDEFLDGFYANLGKAAKLVAGPSAIKQMLDEMQHGLKQLGKNG